MRPAAWFLILFGACYLVPGFWMFRHHQQIRDTWQPITAVSDGVSVVAGRHKQQTVYYTWYELRYRVDSRDYVTPIARRGWTRSRRRAEELAAPYAEATHHTIWYNPSNPYAIRNDVGSIRLFFLPALFTGLGILMLWIGAILYRRSGKLKRCPSCGRRSVAPFCPFCGRSQPGNRATPPSYRDRRASWIAGCVFALFGLAMLTASAWWIHRQFYVFETWPETAGTVIDRQFERRNIAGKLSFRGRVQFEYQAGGALLRNVAEAGHSANYAWIRQRFDRFEPGSMHPLRYDPADPSRIRTHTRADLDLFLPFLVLAAVGFIFALCGALLLSSARKTRRICGSCNQEIGSGNRHCSWCGVPIS